MLACGRLFGCPANCIFFFTICGDPSHRETPFLKKNTFFTPLTGAAIAIYFFSGVCALIYEVIWQRLLKLILGNTTYATSITVAVFMGGLAFGAFLVRKKADAIKNKLFVYGVIELLVVFFALMTPLFLKGIDFVYIYLYQTYVPAPMVMLFLHIAISAIILAFPTILMGTTLPILASLVVRNAPFTGWESGVLYSVNTVGALVGAGATGFCLIRLFGVFPAYFIAAGLNLGIGVVSVYLSRFHPGDSTVNVPQSALGEAVSRRKVLHTAVLTWLFIMGFVALGYEIVWIRTVVHLLSRQRSIPFRLFSAFTCPGMPQGF